MSDPAETDRDSARPDDPATRADALTEQAASFFDLWERHVSEHARTAPEAASALRKSHR